MMSILFQKSQPCLPVSSNPAGDAGCSDRWRITASALDQICCDHRSLLGTADPLSLARFILDRSTPDEQAQLRQELTRHPVLANLCRVVNEVLTESGYR